MHAPTQPTGSPNFKPMTLALAGFGLALTVSLTIAFQSLPSEYRVWNLSVIGALGLFAAARLGLWQGVVFTAVAIVLKDVCLYFLTSWWEPYPLSWLYFAGYALIGYTFLRRSASLGRAVGVSLGSALVFFVVSNFVSWLEQAYNYGYSFQGLINCYVAAIPFSRGTFIGDVVFSAAFFGAHAVLSRAYFPAERPGMVVEPVRETEEPW